MKEDPPADFKCKDKFLVQSIAITAERQNLEPNELWPAMERVAKDQIKEKKIRCAFLPPIEHAITQIKEEDESSSHLSSAASSVHLQHQSVAGAAPSSPVQITQTTSTTSTTTVSFQQAAENRNSTISTSSVTSSYSASSSTDSKALQRELDNARETIQQLQMTMEKLQKEANMLRQRKPESGSGSAPTMTAVTLKHSQEGLYPAVYILGAVLIAFLFSLFF
ncbi:phosphatidylinositol-binding protein scs2 [Podila humilis]|nr:phosphatidylinositol-binding protein scs2 [Podila humilis]